jgi:hypothetical protein
VKRVLISSAVMHMEGHLPMQMLELNQMLMRILVIKGFAIVRLGIARPCLVL